MHRIAEAARLALLATPFMTGTVMGCGRDPVPLDPIDPQVVQDQDDMTWDDDRPIPGIC